MRQVINRRQIPITEHGHVPDDILIISSVKDKTAYTPFVKKGVVNYYAFWFILIK